MKSLHTLLKHPGTNLIVGLILIATSGCEIYEAFHKADEMKIGGHHGVFVYGLVHTLKAIPDLFEGAEHAGC